MRRLFVFAVLAAGFVACSSFGSESSPPPTPPGVPPPDAPPGADGSSPEAATPDAVAPFCTTPAPADELYCEGFDDGLPTTQTTVYGDGDGCGAAVLTTANGSQAIESIKGAFTKPDAGSGCASAYRFTLGGGVRKVSVALDARIVSSSAQGYVEFLNVRGVGVLDGGTLPAAALVVQNQTVLVAATNVPSAPVNPQPNGTTVHYVMTFDLDVPKWLTVSANGTDIPLSLPQATPFAPPFTVLYGIPYADRNAQLDVIIDNVRVTTP